MDKPLSSNDLRTGRFLLLLALVLGALARFYAPLTSDFPLMDGGMFFVAAREIGTHSFALPATLPYPTTVPTIPFCYPPLAFYLAALLQLVGVSLETSLRFVPAVFSTACIWAIWNLGRRVFEKLESPNAAAGLAALFWALSPLTFASLLAGGGLTRAPGLFFALWGVERAIRVWRDGDKRALWGVAVLLALALSTHLERARFLALALFVVWAAYDRSPKGLGRLGMCVGGALLLCAPWWGVCLARFGIAPFLASYASGSRDWHYASRWNTALGAEYFPVVVWFALLGMAINARKIPFLWLWFGVIVLTEVRSGRAFIGAPLSLGAAALFFWKGSKSQVSPFARGASATVLILWLAFQSLLGATRAAALPLPERQAMAWCRSNTPTNARFLVVPARDLETWFSDWGGEWFPALANRTSPLTVQGSEWLPNDTFARLQQQYFDVWLLPTWAQSERALAAQNTPFDYVLLPRTRPALEREMRADANLKLVFQNSAALVFARQKAHTVAF